MQAAVRKMARIMAIFRPEIDQKWMMFFSPKNINDGAMIWWMRMGFNFNGIESNEESHNESTRVGGCSAWRTGLRRHPDAELFPGPMDQETGVENDGKHKKTPSTMPNP